MIINRYTKYSKIIFGSIVSCYYICSSKGNVSGAKTTNMNNATEIRNSTTSEFVIFWDGKELPTTKSGALNSKGGILLTAFVPELNARIEHRSNGEHGRKGFSFGSTLEVMDTQAHAALPREIRTRLEYKY